MWDDVELFGIFLVMMSSVPYLIDTLRGTTRPNVVSWFTWTLLTAIGGTIALIEGELGVAMLTYANTISTGSIVFAGLWRGFAKIGWFDVSCQAGALAALCVWLMADSALLALIMLVVTDAIALMPTLRHAYEQPAEETISAYALVSIGSLATLLTIDAYVVISLLYPLYLLLADSIVIGILVLRRQKTVR